MKQIKIRRLMIGTALVALVLTVSVATFAQPQGLGPSGLPQQQQPPQQQQQQTVAPFTVSQAIAKPFVTVTFSYQFNALENGSYFMKCLRKDQADNEAARYSKNLTPERRNGYISGSFSLRLPNDPPSFGKYSFRIFGPLRHIGGKEPFGTIYSVAPNAKLFDEGAFVFSPYNTRLTVPAQIPPRRTLRITWSDVSAHQAAWIGIFKRENNNEHPLSRKSFINLPGGVWEIEAPGELGHYDVRAFIDQGFQTTAIQPFDVTWGTISPVVSGFPASCYPNVSLVVSYANGPPEINATVGIFDATNPSISSPLSWRSMQGKTSGDFVFSAPGNPGRYDVRMVDSAGNVLVRSSAFQVVPASATIRLNARVESGRVVLIWNNPANYQRLSGYYIYRGTAPGKESTTALTAGPIPTDRTAVASTQTNGYIDTDVQRGMKYYYIVKPLNSDLKTFGAPSNEVSVQVPPGK
jgi:hypothetical protein